MSDPKKGFCIQITRVREEQRAGISFARTVSNYTCVWNDTPLDGLTGQMVERGGPGNNTSTGVQNHLCIAARAVPYPLQIADGNHYKTYDYAENHLLPGLLLGDTGKRTGILIHPCHDAEFGYLSSIGCINPAFGLTGPKSRVDLADSRARVVALIEALKDKLGSKFPKRGEIPTATVLITEDFASKDKLA